MSFKEVLEDLKMIKPQIEEILKLLKERQNDNVIEAAAAKIITELKTVIQDCTCNKEILEAIGKRTKIPEQKQIVSTPGNKDKGKTRYRYSFPNHDVGNEELGTGKNPNSMTWPFSSIPKKI